MNATLAKVLKFTGFLGLGVLILWVIWDKMCEADRQSTFEALRSAKYGWVGLSVLCGIFSHLSRAQRWRMLIRPLGYSPRYFVTFLTVMIGYVANLAFPRLGEVLKCTFLSRYEKIPADKLIGTMIVERLIDAISLLLAVALALITQYPAIRAYMNGTVEAPEAQCEPTSWPAWLGTAIYIAVGAVVLFVGYKLWKMGWTRLQEKVRGIFYNVRDGLTSVRKVGNIWMFVGHSFFIWLMYFAMVQVCFPALVETSSLGLGAGITVLVSGSLGILVSPGGIGAYQYIVQATLSIYGVASAAGLALGIIVWSAQTIMIIVLGLLALLILPLFKPKEDAQQPSE